MTNLVLECNTFEKPHPWEYPGTNKPISANVPLHLVEKLSRNFSMYLVHNCTQHEYLKNIIVRHIQ